MGHSALNKVLVLAFVLALVLQSGKRVANTSWEIGISLAHILFCIFKVSTNHKTSAAEREKKSTDLERNLFFKSGWASVKTQLNVCLWPTAVSAEDIRRITSVQNWFSLGKCSVFPQMCIFSFQPICLQWAVAMGVANVGCSPLCTPPHPGGQLSPCTCHSCVQQHGFPSTHLYVCVMAFFKIFVQKWGFTAALG